jgi:hypothetical protein
MYTHINVHTTNGLKKIKNSSVQLSCTHQANSSRHNNLNLWKITLRLYACHVKSISRVSDMGFDDGIRACTVVQYHMYQKKEDEGLSKNFICIKELIWIKMKEHSFFPFFVKMGADARWRQRSERQTRERRSSSVNEEEEGEAP